VSRTISSDYTKRGLVNYRTWSPIRATDWRVLARHQNLIWARFISEWGGHVFDPPFEAAGGGASPVNDSTGRDLDELSLGGIVTRPLDSGDYRVGLAVYGGGGKIEADVINKSTSTTVASIAAGPSTSWSVGTADLTSAEVEDGSGGVGYLAIENLTMEADAGTSLFQLRAGEIEITTASEIPTS
jgi:hypothetical protein